MEMLEMPSQFPLHSGGENSDCCPAQRITANVMFSFQILVGYSGRNWKCRVCVLWELLGLRQDASEKLGTEILLRAQAVTFWVNQMCRSPGVQQFSFLPCQERTELWPAVLSTSV